MWLKHCFSLHKDTTPPQPNHTVTPTLIEPEKYNTWNKSTVNRNLLKMDVLTFETCWVSDVKLAYLYSTIKMIHGPINLRYQFRVTQYQWYVIFPLLNLSNSTVVLRSTQPLNRNEYQEYLLGGKGGRCVGLTTLPSSCTDCLEILAGPNFPEPKEPVQGFSGYLYFLT